jgi:hypothetical protein
MDRISGRSLAARLFGASPARTLALLQAAWPLAVGPELARRTAVIGIEGGTLRVRVPDASWRKVLHRIQPQILGRLRDVAGDLAPRRMGFLEGGLRDSATGSQGDAQRRPDDGGFQGGSRTPTSRGVSAPPGMEDIQAQAAAIADAEIRSRFLGAAARYLARAKGRTDA